MTNPLRWLIVSFAVGSLAACSSDEPGPKQTEDNSLRTDTAFCNAWAKAACNDLVVKRCNDDSKEACIDHQSDFCTTMLPFGYSSKRAQECIDAVKAAYADAELDLGELEVVLRLGGACGHLVNGGQSKGLSCTTSSDCDTVHDYECIVKAGSAEGTCQIPDIVDVGQSCDADAAVCAQGNYCAELKSGKTICAEVSAMGGDCGADAECTADTSCVIPDGDTTGTCTPKFGLKHDCTSDEECSSGFCLTSANPPFCADSVILTAESSLCVNL